MSSEWLRVDRSKVDPEEYTRHFAARNSPLGVAELVRVYLQDSLGNPDFPVLPSDNVAEVYGLAEEDFVDAFFELLALCGQTDDLTQTEIDQLPPIDTVEQLVDGVAFLAAIHHPEQRFPGFGGQIIDRAGRDAIALSIRRFLNNRLTNAEFQRALDGVRWNGNDGAIPGAKQDIAANLGPGFRDTLTNGKTFRFSDRPEYSEHRQDLLRVAGFLYSDRPYQWRWQRSVTNREILSVGAFIVTAIGLYHYGNPVWGDVSLSLGLGLGLLCWGSARRSRHRQERDTSGLYPFQGRADCLSAIWRPRLLAKPRRLA